jgi:hypothetical protein
MGHDGRHFKIADIEKALIDYLHLHSDLITQKDIESMRLNTDVIHSNVDWKKLEAFAGRIGQTALNKRLAELRRYVDNA